MKEGERKGKRENLKIKEKGKELFSFPFSFILSPISLF